MYIKEESIPLYLGIHYTDAQLIRLSLVSRFYRTATRVIRALKLSGLLAELTHPKPRNGQSIKAAALL